MSTSVPTFEIASYTNLPYLNVNEGIDISLNTLFDYQKLTIPPTPPSDEYYILNIKKQFICISYNDLSSGIYVKKSIIKDTDLSLIKTNEQKDAFNTELDKQVNFSKSGVDGTGKPLFDKVYEKIGVDKKPYFAPQPGDQYKGGKKGGGTRKTQSGSRSR